MSSDIAPSQSSPVTDIRSLLGSKSLVFVGLMGAGKTSVGRRVAEKLSLEFYDADVEIERAANMTIPEIFEAHGEPEFRRGERQVIGRLLSEQQMVLSTGGGAYMDAETRATISDSGIAIWLRAELDVLMARVRRRSNRPLLQADDPEKVMRELMDERYPVYSEAHVTVESRAVSHDETVAAVLSCLHDHLTASHSDV